MPTSSEVQDRPGYTNPLRSIGTQILGQLVFAVVAFGAFSALYFPHVEEKARTADLLEQTELTGKLLAREVGVTLASGEYANLIPMTAWVREQSEIRGLWVAPLGELEIELVNKDEISPPDEISRPTRNDLQRVGPNGRFQTYERGEILYAWHVLGADGELGLLGFAFSRSQILKDAARSQKVAALFCLILCLALVVGGTIHTRSITGPLRELEDGAAEISRGNFEFNFGSMTNNECSALARSFETMSHRMQEMITDLVRETERAREASVAKSRFLANMSHEIRTPMTAILGFSDEVLRTDISEEDRNDCLRTIQVNGQHLLTIINGILDLSKVEAGKLELEELSVSPFEIVDSAHNLMKVTAQEKGINLQIEFTTKLPDRILTDPTRVRQILINIIGNAIKFTEQGTVLVLVSFEDDDNPLLCIRVYDSGIGMSEEQLEKVFQPFVQADDTTTRKFGGTGLGLTISHKLAQLLGGDIHVSSEPNHGTIFQVTISAGSHEAHVLLEWEDFLRAQSSDLPRLGGEAAESKLNARILIVDDNGVNRKLIERVLARQGADTTCAENGQMALDMIGEAAEKGDPFELILMDMQMPVLNGWEATHQLRAKGCTTPVIALTANTMATDRAKCLEAGCDDFASKPIDREALFATLRKWIGVRSDKAA